MVVVFRVNLGRDAFPLRVLVDRRNLADDDIVPEARRRACCAPPLTLLKVMEIPAQLANLPPVLPQRQQNRLEQDRKDAG